MDVYIIWLHNHINVLVQHEILEDMWLTTIITIMGRVSYRSLCVKMCFEIHKSLKSIHYTFLNVSIKKRNAARQIQYSFYFPALCIAQFKRIRSNVMRKQM